VLLHISQFLYDIHTELQIILPAALGPGVYSASNRNEYQELIKIIFLGSEARPARKADNLTAISEPIV
jgi:hypothetical protein